MLRFWGLGLRVYYSTVRDVAAVSVPFRALPGRGPRPLAPQRRAPSGAHAREPSESASACEARSPAIEHVVACPREKTKGVLGCWEDLRGDRRMSREQAVGMHAVTH